ncbi:MAG: hypothetical protein HY794_07000 [Desulfarculus sp.]|nr:hypothetical protein [Desulfarculus sp.]
MLIEDIPYHLRNTITELVAPIYVELGPDHCHPPSNMALGDSLMMLGLIQNQGRRVRLLMDPGPWRDLVESHPLVAEVAAPPGEPERLGWYAVPVAKDGRGQVFLARESFTFGVPVLPVDQIRSNPVAAHSAYYRLANTSDRPGAFVDPQRPLALAGLLSKGRPTLVVYPLNPGRADPFWQDMAWWRQLLGRLKERFALVAVGADDYGELGEVLDFGLPKSDPASRLVDLAALMGAAAGCLARDSYRLWASATARHLVFSNPYLMRYPQANRVLDSDYNQLLTRFSMAGLGLQEGNLPPQAALEVLKRLFGSELNVRRNLMTLRERNAESQSVAYWRDQPQLRERYHQESMDLACRALTGQVAPGGAWVAPVFP